MAREALIITIPGKPMPKGRPRFNGKGRRAYTPHRTVRAERDIGWSARQAMAGAGRFTGPLKVTVQALIPIPKRWSKLKRSMAAQQEIWPGKPDIDNYVKLALDAMNEIVFSDDDQVVEISASKRYAADPAMIITIEEFKA